MTNQKNMEISVTPKMTENVKAYKKANAERGYDARTKTYKICSLVMDNSQKAIHEEVIAQANKYLADNGVIIKFEDGFKLKLRAYVNMYGYELVTDVHIEIEGRPNLSLEETPIEEVKAKIEEAHQKWIESKNAGRARDEKATKMYELVKGEETYKDREWEMEDTGVWKGNEISRRSVGEGWNVKAEQELQIRESKISCRLDVRIEVKTPEEAKAFWDKAKAFVEAFPELKLLKKEVENDN